MLQVFLHINMFCILKCKKACLDSSSSSVYYIRKQYVNGGHYVSPGGLQAYSLSQPWLCRAPKVGRGGEGCAYVSM